MCFFNFPFPECAFLVCKPKKCHLFYLKCLKINYKNKPATWAVENKVTFFNLKKSVEIISISS